MSGYLSLVNDDQLLQISKYLEGNSYLPVICCYAELSTIEILLYQRSTLFAQVGGIMWTNIFTKFHAEYIDKTQGDHHILGNRYNSIIRLKTILKHNFSSTKFKYSCSNNKKYNGIFLPYKKHNRLHEVRIFVCYECRSTHRSQGLDE